jgi:hypothetical protein
MNTAMVNRGRFILGLLAVLVCGLATGPVLAGDLAVPAEFVRDIKLPGFGETILRPSALHFDRHHDEILVGDSGNNRILIFGESGVFKFSFSLAQVMTLPQDIVTDAEGYIFVLGSDVQGQLIQRFDFDGTPLNPIRIPGRWNDIPVEDGSITATINLEHDVELAEQLTDGTAGGMGSYALGTLACFGNTLYVPVSNVGTVYTYSTDGEFLGSIGHFGSKPGTLNFPVAVEVSPEGLILVLDRARYCVVCFSPENQVLGEFGGKGISPGWFMGPTLLAVPSADLAIVGQVFRNKIQVCTVPEFIRVKAGQISAGQTAGNPELSGSSPAVRHPVDLAQRRLSNSSRPLNTPVGESSPSDNNNVPDTRNVSYPEVSE